MYIQVYRVDSNRNQFLQFVIQQHFWINNFCFTDSDLVLVLGILLWAVRIRLTIYPSKLMSAYKKWISKVFCAVKSERLQEWNQVAMTSRGIDMFSSLVQKFKDRGNKMTDNMLYIKNNIVNVSEAIVRHVEVFPWWYLSTTLFFYKLCFRQVSL